MPIQVKITTSMGIYNFTLFNKLQDQGWELNVSGQPTAIEFDPDNWILKDIVGTTSTGGEKIIPTSFSLSQNYPNPFNPETTISYTLQEASNVSLKVYDVLGREVAMLVNEFLPSGTYKATFNVETRHGASLQSGVYFYRLQAGSLAETKKLVLMK